MRIVEYRQKRHKNSVAALFSAIYPDWTMDECARMSYSDNFPAHHLTLLAFCDERLIGQLNVFRVAPNADLGNIGFHVHPLWHRKGVAASLLCTAWEAIANAFTDGLVIQTEKKNYASINLAIKAGFMTASQDILKKYGEYLKYQYFRDGVCFHRPKCDPIPNISLQLSASRAGTKAW